MTARSELGALVAAMALGGVVFAVQQSHETPATLRGPVGDQRAAAPAPAAAKSSFPVARRAVAPDLAARRAALRRRVARHQRAVARRAAQQRTAGPAPRRRVPAVPVVVRVQRPVAAPRPVTLSAPRGTAPPVVARPAPRPVVRPAPVVKPKPKPQPKPPPSTGVSFVDTG
jgi:hypothetical protein